MNLTPALEAYAKRIASERGIEHGEALLLIFLGCRVPDELKGDAESFRSLDRKGGLAP